MARARDWRGVPGLKVYAVPDDTGEVGYLIAAYDARYANRLAKSNGGKRAHRISTREGERLLALGVSEMQAAAGGGKLSRRRESFNDGLRRNPPLVTFGNPPRGEIMSRRVYELAYKHAADGKAYKHDFAAGVCMEALPDGSIRIYSMRGKRLWGDF